MSSNIRQVVILWHSGFIGSHGGDAVPDLEIPRCIRFMDVVMR